MSKWVILIGNGLGLSLDGDFFSLDTGMKKAWNGLEEPEKLIIKCLLGEIPQRENDLRILQHINKVRRSRQESSKLLNAFEKFRKGVAGSYICLKESPFFSEPRFINFANQLASFVLRQGENDKWNNICLATVNYDNLLYSHYLLNSNNCSFGSLRRKIIGDNVEGALQDGFCKKNGKIVFDPYCLYHSANRRHQGYYLHLHGSIKYHSVNGKIQKIPCEDIEISEITTKDLVLANSEEKGNAINDSPLLRHYWKIFRDRIFQCDTMIILGCGGQDEHINNLMKDRIKNKENLPNIIIGIRKKDADDEMRIWEKNFEDLLSQDLISSFERGDENALKQIPDPAEQSKNIFAIMENTLAFQWSIKTD